MDDEDGGDRWSIGDLRRDRSPMPRVDRLFTAAEAPDPARGKIETRLERLEQRIDELERLRRLSDRTSTKAAGYILFFPGSRGYEIVEHDGVAPAVGTPITVAGKPFIVEGTRRSPFWPDDRPCLVLSLAPPQQIADLPTPTPHTDRRDLLRSAD